jgi:hypothetical protein
VLALYQSACDSGKRGSVSVVGGGGAAVLHRGHKGGEAMRVRLKLSLVLILTVFAVPCVGQAPEKQPQEKTIAVFGQTIHYWDVGSGPVLVLVHGLGSSKDGDWGRWWRRSQKNIV